MSKHEKEWHLNAESQHFLLEFTAHVLDYLHKDKDRTQRTIQTLQRLMLMGQGNYAVLIQQYNEAQTQAEHQNKLHAFMRHLPESADYMVFSGGEIGLPDPIGDTIMNYASRDSIIEVRFDVQDELGNPLEDPTVGIPKFGRVDYVLIGEQIGIRAYYGKDDEERGVVMPTLQPTAFTLVQIQKAA